MAMMERWTRIHTMATTVGSVLAVAIAWNTLGWDTVAMTSEVQEVVDQEDNRYEQQQQAIDAMRLNRLYDRLADHRMAVASEKRILRENPGDEIAEERIINIETDMDRINREIANIVGGN